MNHDHDNTPDVEFDLAHIDMMIPHHRSLIALSKVAQNDLTNPDLVAMARSFVAAQGRARLSRCPGFVR